MTEIESRVHNHVRRIGRDVAPVDLEDVLAGTGSPSHQTGHADGAGSLDLRSPDVRGAVPAQPYGHFPKGGRARRITAVAAVLLVVLVAGALLATRTPPDTSVAAGGTPENLRAEACGMVDEAAELSYSQGRLGSGAMATNPSKREALRAQLERFERKATESGDAKLAALAGRLRVEEDGKMAALAADDVKQMMPYLSRSVEVLAEIRATCDPGGGELTEEFAVYQAAFDRFQQCLNEAGVTFLSGPTLKSNAPGIPYYEYRVGSDPVTYGVWDRCYTDHLRDWSLPLRPRVNGG